MAEATEKFDVLNRFTRAVQFTAEITCSPDASMSLKLGLAIKWAVKARANLSGADLSGADLSEEALRSFKADLFLTLSSLFQGPLDAQHLVAKLRAGQVDGSSYGHGGNECACLVGTIAQPRGVGGDQLDHDSGRPAERWFMMINPGDKAGAVGEDGKETAGGYAARKALEWTIAWCEAHGIDPDGAPKSDAEQVVLS